MYSASQLRTVSGEVFHESRGSWVLVADHIFDVRSGGVVDHQAVLVSDGKIARIAPLGARVRVIPRNGEGENSETLRGILHDLETANGRFHVQDRRQSVRY